MVVLVFLPDYGGRTLRRIRYHYPTTPYMMFALPIKMYLRWAFNLKYIVAIPEYFFNI